MRISSRTIRDHLPKFLPMACALGLMIASGFIRDTLVNTKQERCCAAMDLAWPKLDPHLPPKEGQLPAESYAARVNYVASLQVQVVAIGASFGFGAVLIFPLLRAGNRHSRSAFTLGIMAVGVASMALVIQPTTSLAFHNLIQATIRSEFEQWRIGFERATSLAATFLVSIAGLLLFPVSGTAEDRLQAAARNHTRLSHVLALGTVLLGGSVLLRTCVGVWITTYFEASSRPTITTLVHSIVAGWAVYDSLFLAVTFVPAAVVLRNRIRNAAEEIDLKAPPAWFDPKWLSGSPLQDVSRVVAIFTPFLVGQASEVLGFLK